jgi:hypothetical protein
MVIIYVKLHSVSTDNLADDIAAAAIRFLEHVQCSLSLLTAFSLTDYSLSLSALSLLSASMQELTALSVTAYC